MDQNQTSDCEKLIKGSGNPQWLTIEEWKELKDLKVTFNRVERSVTKTLEKRSN